MSSRRSISFLLVLIFMLCDAAAARGTTIEEAVRDSLASGRNIEGEPLHTISFLGGFYEGQEYRPVWIKSGGISSEGRLLIKQLEASSKEGLSPGLYHTEKIQELISKDAASHLSDIELLMSDAFFSLAFHYAYGAVDAQNAKVRWFEQEASEKLKIAAQTVINTGNVEGPLKSLLPKNPAYETMKNAFLQYEGMAGKVQWKEVPGLAKGQKINPGDEDGRVPLIRERLGVVKKVTANEQFNPDIYDGDLEQAVIKFQRENGLLDDGVIGYRTVDAMNVAPEQRICTLKINLDRIRAMANIFDEPRRVMVNIPAFWLETYENGNLALDMKVIAGMVKRKTPTLSSEMDHLIFSPKWYVPDTIFYEDKLPHIRKDPSYLRRHGMRVYSKEGGEVDPESIDWTQFQSKHVPYRVVQGSGDANALGRVKFKFPNRYDVYLHDTPQKNLFKNAQRNFSSGCIRIEKPVELAALLLKDKPEWNEEKIKDAMGRSHEQFVPLSRTMPIHIIYMTAWVDKSGTIQFRDDIYGRDGAYKKLLCD